MSRSTPQGAPHDWVTRAADDAIRHHESRGRRAGHLLLRHLPSGPVHLGNLREFLTAALRRRRAAPPRRTRAPPARLGRLRPVPQGAGRRRPVVGRAHRPPALGRPRPVGLPRLVGRALQGAARAARCRAGRRDGGDLADRALPVGCLPRRGPARGAAPRTRSSAVLAQLPHQEGRARVGRRARARRPRRWPTRSPTTTRTPRPAPASLSATSRSSPTAATAAATPPTVTAYDDDTHRPRVHLLRVRLPRHHQPRHARTRASWSGRSTGRCAGRSSTSTSSRPGWTTRRPGSSFTVGHELVESVSGLPARRRGSATASSGSPACRRCRRPRVARPPPRTPCGCSRRRSCAGSTSAASRSRPSTSTSGPRWCGCTTSGTPWRRKAADPAKRDVQVLAYERAVVDPAAGPLPTPRGRRTVPDARRRSPT